MALDIIRQITENEKEGEKIRAEALAKAKEIRRSAEEYGENVLRTASLEGRKAAGDILESAAREAEEIKALKLEQSKNSMAHMRAEAEKKVDACADFIFTELKKR